MSLWFGFIVFAHLQQIRSLVKIIETVIIRIITRFQDCGDGHRFHQSSHQQSGPSEAKC